MGTPAPAATRAAAVEMLNVVTAPPPVPAVSTRTEGSADDTGTMALTEKLTTLTDQMRTEQNLMVKLVESQLELKSVLARLADASEAPEPGIDDATRGHIRNIEIYLARMLEEVTQGRTHTVEEIRSEIKLLARTIAAVAEEG